MRDAIWKAMLDADMNVRYWKYLAQRYVARDRNFKIFLAITSSGTVAGWAVWAELPLIWKCLSAASAVTSIVLPVLNHQKTIEELSDLSGKWWELLREYNAYWDAVESNQNLAQLQSDFTKTKAKEDPLVKKESLLPHDEFLLRSCQQEVLHSRGLDK